MIVPLLIVNGAPLAPQPFVAVMAGRTVVPVRALAEALGERVSYDPGAATVTILHAGHRHTVRIAMRHADRALAYADELGPLLHATVVEDAALHRIEFTSTMVMVPRPIPSLDVRYGAPH